MLVRMPLLQYGENLSTRNVNTKVSEQKHKKLGIIIHYLDQFNHNWSLHMPRAQGQTALQSEPRERASSPSRIFTWVRMAMQPYNCFFMKVCPP